MQSDKDRSVRSLAAFALGEIESLKAVEALTSELQKVTLRARGSWRRWERLLLHFRKLTRCRRRKLERQSWEFLTLERAGARVPTLK